jgi:hypothetical protein
MGVALLLGTTPVSMISIVLVVKYYIVGSKSPARGIAIVYAICQSSSMLFFFFLVLTIASAKLEVSLIGLGLGMAVLNFLIAYPIGYFGYRLVVERFLMRHLYPDNQHR